MAEGRRNENLNSSPAAGGPMGPGMGFPGGGGRGGFGGRMGGASWMTATEKPKSFKKTMQRLWEYSGKERKLLLAVFMFTLTSAGLGMTVPYLIGRSIEVMSPGMRAVDFEMLLVIAGLLLLSYLTDAGMVFLQGWIMAGVSQRIVKVLRSTLFAKLQKLPVSFFDTRTHGDLMSRLSNDIENVSSTVSNSTAHLMSSSVTIIGSFVMMVVFSPTLTLASLITVPLVFFFTRGIARKTRMFFREQQACLGMLNGHIEESISGIYVVKAFNHEEKVIDRFDDINGRLYSVGVKAQIASGFLMPMMNVINNIGFTAVAAVGGVLAVKDMITVGVIASFLIYSRQFVRPLNEIANVFNTLQSAVAGAERVFEILDEKEEREDVPGAVELKDAKGKVEFYNVSFGYRRDVPVLKNVTLTAEEGSNTALVGPTGAGKTTVVNLLTRFYDVTEGNILIDDRDIREYTRDSLRKCFGIVLQDTYLFSGTIRENIKYGRLDATDEEMEAAAAMANADVFIKRLLKGYDTVLSESGGNLSQGQRQLLAIARAILSEPSILILDEATSSVDTRTELHIQEAMLKLMKGRTSFIIAHRLSTIRDTDTILVIDGGEVAERGDHEKLLAKKGIYYGMYFSGAAEY